MATRICSGFGDCWESNGEDRKYDDVLCNHNCQRKDCANAPVCGLRNFPEWVTDFKHGVCISCSMSYRKRLEFSEDECPVCLETKTCVTMLNCSHKECIDCFKRAWNGEEPPPQPEFPLPDRQDEYDEGLLDDHPLIVKWQEDCEKWEDTKADKWCDEEYLRCCPLCRK